MPSVLLLALLASNPAFDVAPSAAGRVGGLLDVRRTVHATPSLTVQLDLGGLLGAAWYVPSGRANLEAARDLGLGVLLSGQRLDSEVLLLAAPVVGPWVQASRSATAGDDAALLLATGALQALGLAVGAVRMADDGGDAAGPTGPVVSVSPIAGGRLGLTVRITGF